MSNSQHNKLKSGIKNGTKVTLNLSSYLIGNYNHKPNFSCKVVWTDTQVSKIGKALANGSSANIKFSKTDLSKTVQLRIHVQNWPTDTVCPAKWFSTLWR